MSTCTFFGHRDCPDSISEKIYAIIEHLICEKDAHYFLVGNNGNFDHLVKKSLESLSEKYNIKYDIVLAYCPAKKEESDTEITGHEHYILWDNFESTPKKFAIDKRNLFMLKKSDIVVTYITHNFGTGAAKYAELAVKKKKTVINIPNFSI